MRLPFIYVITFFTTCMLWSQSPEKMSYQAIVRDSDNTLVSDAQVSLRIIVRQGSVTGTNTYEETHSANTNANGLVSLEIGAGNRVSGNFSTIPWANGPFFIETQVDPNGGSSYAIIGVSQLLSVPYALHAKYAENLTGAAVSNSIVADIISFTFSRNIGVNDINNTIACTKTATLTLSPGFSAMKIGETINLEAHNGATLTVKAAGEVLINYTEEGNANFESDTGNVRFGLLRKSADNAYIISGQ